MREERKKIKENPKKSKSKTIKEPTPGSFGADGIEELGRDFSELLTPSSPPKMANRKNSIDALSPNDYIIQRVKEDSSRIVPTQKIESDSLDEDDTANTDSDDEKGNSLF